MSRNVRRKGVLAPAGLVVGLVLLAASPALALPLDPGDTAYKTHPAAAGFEPKYTIGLPGYFIPGNVVGSLVSPILGGLSGQVTTTVYQNPGTGFLAFQYVVEGAADLASPIVRTTLGGGWMAATVTDAGADASGTSGTGDPGAEWTDGDPMSLSRSPDGGLAIQWREGSLGTAIGPKDISSLIWFETESTVFRDAPIAFLDTALTGEATVLAPGSVIPLPTGACMGLVGLGCVAGGRRR